MPSAADSAALAARPRRRPTARGHATRLAILEAALGLIARQGVHAVTHRAIAADAGVALASTTYFFDSLPQLLLEAFQHYVAQSHEGNMQALGEAADLVAHSVAGGESRAALQAQVLDFIVGFMTRQLQQSARGQAVEAQFLNMAHPTPDLAAAITAYRQALVDGMAAVLAPLTGAHAPLDASLLLGVIHRFDAEGLRAGALPEDQLRAEVGRLLSLVLRTD